MKVKYGKVPYFTQLYLKEGRIMAISEARSMPTSKDSLTIYLEPEIKQALQEWAKSEKRSMSFIASQLVEEAVKARQKEGEGDRA